jgi:radical SAM superfamily enzyme YgiQ (UPF0313 family)
MKRTNNIQKVLLVNPWVYDFKAFDFWNKPVGLLIVASILKRFGFGATLLDCMDRNSPYYKTETKTDVFGRGKYAYEIAEKPSIFANVPRFYKRYGMPEDLFIDIIRHMTQPDIIFITSSMTYWYPGVFNAIRILKDTFPKTPVVLGGIYANLCTKHAREKSGADIILEGAAEIHLPKLLSEFGHHCNSLAEPDQIAPDFSVYDNLSYGVVLTSRGCPFDCTYCATKTLYPGFKIMPQSTVIEQLDYLADRTDNIAFFDDALLFNNELPELLDKIAGRKFGFKFHASNGLHCRFLEKGIASKMHRANFKTMYLSLETVNPVVQKQTGGKVSTDEFIDAVNILKETGFAPDALHAYILYGMPGQKHEEVVSSIQLCQELSIHPHLCEFSPIPHTREYEKTGFNENTDPLYHNNLFYTWYYPEPKFDLYRRIKRLLT